MRDNLVQPHRKATIEVDTLLIRIRENRYSIHQLQLRSWDLRYHCHKPRHMPLVIHQLQKVKVSSILKLFCWMKYNYWKMIKPKRNKLLNEWLILNFQVRKYMKHRTKRATPTEFYDQDEDNKDDDDMMMMMMMTIIHLNFHSCTI